MIILRYTRWGDTYYATVPESQLRAKFPPKLRVKKVLRSPIGDIRELEDTGDYLRDRVDLYFDGGRDRFGRELRPGNTNARCHGLRLLDHKSHARVLTQADQDALDNYDADIERLVKELDDVRQERREYVQKCWRRARPVGLGELEDRAKADLKARNA